MSHDPGDEDHHPRLSSQHEEVLDYVLTTAVGGRYVTPREIMAALQVSQALVMKSLWRLRREGRIRRSRYGRYHAP